MADDVETPDPALAVQCPWEGGCGAPVGVPCRTSYDGESHAERRRIAHLRSLEQGVCADCGRFLVRGAHEPGGPVEVWHPDPNHHDCPPMPDPREDWNAYAKALQSGQQPGHVPADRFIPTGANPGKIAQAVQDISNDTGSPAAAVASALAAAARADHVHGDHAHLDARIDALHGPGAAAALDAALADGSIFADALPRPVAVEVGVICPECDNGKHPNCDGRALHPVTDELTACTCPCTDQGGTL